MTVPGSTTLWPVNPKLDLVLQRQVDVPPELVWEAWTTPSHLKQWFCPKPWRVTDCEIDLRPGGVFHTVMQGPEGQQFPGTGCYLEVIPNRRLVWTSVLHPGYRPAPAEDMPFTGVILLEPHGTGTRYTAIALHRDPEGKTKHEAMGFHTGWNTALDQMIEMIKGRST